MIGFKTNCFQKANNEHSIKGLKTISIKISYKLGMHATINILWYCFRGCANAKKRK